MWLCTCSLIKQFFWGIFELFYSILFIRLLDSRYCIFLIQEIETEANNQPIHGWNANIHSVNAEENVNFGSVNT